MDKLTDGVASAPLAEVVSELSCYLGDVSADLFGKLTDADVLAELQEFEVLRRRLAVVDHALVAELGRRALAGRLVLGSHLRAVAGGAATVTPRGPAAGGRIGGLRAALVTDR